MTILILCMVMTKYKITGLIKPADTDKMFDDSDFLWFYVKEIVMIMDAELINNLIHLI